MGRVARVRRGCCYGGRMADRAAIGRAGEEMAAGFLQGRGFSILERNLRVGRNEIDLLCESPHGELTLVEVKTSVGASAPFPEQRIDWRKRTALIRCARLLRGAMTGRRAPIRFDVVAVTMNPGAPAKIIHFPHAFEA